MNRIYRKVWNKALGQMVVASELASGHGGGGTTDRRVSGGASHSALTMAVVLSLGLAAGPAMAQVAPAGVAVGGYHQCRLADDSLGWCATPGTAYASAVDSVAVGFAAFANAPQATALGGFSRAYANQAVALGFNASAALAGATAVGANAYAYEVGAAALGTGAQALAASSV